MAGAKQPRPNPPNTAFRRFYERSDLPITLEHRSAKTGLQWKVRASLTWFELTMWTLAVLPSPLYLEELSP